MPPEAALSKRERLAIQRQDMPTRPADARVSGFTEVNLGYTRELAILEANRCLMCRHAPCIAGCPVMVDVPAFLLRLQEGDLAGAADSLLNDNALPAVTGRVCPQETQCEQACILARKGKSVAIGHLERFVADWARQHADRAPPSGLAPSGLTPSGLTPSGPTPSGLTPSGLTPSGLTPSGLTPSGLASTTKRVAVIGSGPGGLTAAGELAKRGYDVTVYEALHVAGGVLVYGIPEFRLPNDIVAEEVARLEQLGVHIECNAVIGRTYSLDELRDAFNAVFISVGAGLPAFMGIPGENLKGVYSANEYLTRINLMQAYAFPEADTPVLHGRRVVVVGGGNVAVDAVRTARRLGAQEAILAYRRTRAEMPARIEEIVHAVEEGVRLEPLVTPVAVEGDADRWVSGLRCQRMNLGEPDESGRRRPVPIEGSEHVIPCDTVVMAIGTRANPLLTASCPELELARSGNIVTDERGMTNLPGVFAGGDIVRGSATVILAMGDGKRAAATIDEYLTQGVPTSPLASGRR